MRAHNQLVSFSSAFFPLFSSNPSLPHPSHLHHNIISNWGMSTGVEGMLLLGSRVCEINEPSENSEPSITVATKGNTLG